MDIDIVEQRLRACLESNGPDSSGGTRGGYGSSPSSYVSIPRTSHHSHDHNHNHNDHDLVIVIGSSSASSRHHGPVVGVVDGGTVTDQSHPAVRQPEHHDRDRRGREAGFGRGDCYGRGHGVVYDRVF